MQVAPVRQSEGDNSGETWEQIVQKVTRGD